MTDESEDIIKKLDNTQSLLDVMLCAEDYFDSLDLFVFKNWIDGEIVDGPYVERYWVKFTLKYPFKDMPDPDGGLRLLKYGTKVAFQKCTEDVPVKIETSNDIDPETGKAKLKKLPIWLVHIKIPRRFINDLDIDGLDLHSEDAGQVEDFKNAQAEGIDSSTGIDQETSEPTEEATTNELEI